MAIALLIVLPLSAGRDMRFAGADGAARDQVTAIAPAYKPWSEPLWTPPSGEIEGLLFTLQAAFGAGLIGYYFGFCQARFEREKKI